MQTVLRQSLISGWGQCAVSEYCRVHHPDFWLHHWPVSPLQSKLELETKVIRRRRRRPQLWPHYAQHDNFGSVPWPSLWLWNLRFTFVSSSSLRPSPPWRISCPTLAWTPDYQHTCNKTSWVNKNSFRLSLCCFKSLCSHVHFEGVISC